MVIHFYYFGRVKPSTSAYCKLWTFFQYTLTVSNEFLMATISIQRHILIFNSHLLHVRIKRFFLYYFPLLLCIIYPMFLYLSLVVIYSCNGTQWDFTLNLCGFADCFLGYNRILSAVDWTVNGGLPIIVITIANMSLVIRVVWQKHRRQQIISWQKQRHMTLQLLSISCLYMIAWFPNTIFAIIYHITESNAVSRIHINYIYELLYLACLFIPWVIIGMLPGFKKWILQKLRQQSMIKNTVAPARMRLTVTR